MTILLDTNVLSELLRARPDSAVLAWMATQPPDALFVSAVTQAEMMLGARLLPAGKRRSSLETSLIDMFGQDFGGRVLPFDSGAVPHFVEIVSERRGRGRPIAQFDAQIAAIARRAGASLATRTTGDFEGCGVTLVDPWTFD